MKKNLNVLIYSLTSLIIVLIVVYAYFNRYSSYETINVTGFGEKDFTADLIVWEASFTRMSTDMNSAYADLRRDAWLIKEYLRANNIKDEEFVFSSIKITRVTEYRNLDQYGYVDVFKGYQLEQNVKIESKNVTDIEKISRNITELLDKGVELRSEHPLYYYTGLKELKIEMIADATRDARERATEIAENSNAKLGKLKKARMGVFQIVARNSDEDYSWGGSYNLSSKYKTATITIRGEYKIK